MVSNKLHYASEMENLFDAELIADVDKHGVIMLKKSLISL